VRLVRVPIESAFGPFEALRALRSDTRPFALVGEWAGGGAVLGSEPVKVAPPGADPFALLDSLSEGEGGSDDAARAGAVGGGWFGYLGYGLGARVERLSPPPPRPRQLPPFSLAYYDHVLRLDSDGQWWFEAFADEHPRLAVLRERLTGAAAEPRSYELGAFTAYPGRAAHARAVEWCRRYIAAGDLYQANLTRRLETGFDGDPWDLYRHLRTGDPSLFSAYLDLGPSQLTGRPRALLSASPEPFLSVDADGVVKTDPIKGTRPRGRDAATDRALARELLSSAKDRAENVMIVDVLRNDLGRVCRPGSVRVPRLCRLERTAAVQHLVSTVTGVLDEGRDAFDLLAVSFPGGSITGAPKIRAMEILEGLEPVRRGPYTGTIGWIGPDGAMQTSIVIRTFVADGRRLTIHVGGGITWKSDPAEEWEETVAKASGPLGAIGGVEVG
jgi:para-aminobenzoate synthetase / 4-amino-4-deoxychorismate lyase